MRYLLVLRGRVPYVGGWKMRSFCSFCIQTFPTFHPSISNPLLWTEWNWELVGRSIEGTVVASSVRLLLALSDELKKGDVLLHSRHSPQILDICTHSVLIFLVPVFSQDPDGFVT